MTRLVKYYRTVYTGEDSVHHVAVSGKEHNVVQCFSGQIGIGVLAVSVSVIEIACARREIRTEDVSGWNNSAIRRLMKYYMRKKLNGVKTE